MKSNADAGRGLLPEDVTVAEVLRDAGYTTGLVGKWGLGPDNGDNPSHPNSQGFDYFFGYLNQRHAHDYWPTYLWRNGERVDYPENVGADTTYAADLFTAEALGFLDRLAPGERFFLDVSLTTPHAPNEIPSDAPYSDRPWPKGERNHAAQVTATDAQIGVILAGLAARGLAEDTVVLVVSDNGPHKEGANYDGVGSRLPHDAEFFDSNGPLRGIKRDVYEGGIRVPMIARVPESLRATGRRRRAGHGRGHPGRGLGPAGHLRGAGRDDGALRPRQRVAGAVAARGDAARSRPPLLAVPRGRLRRGGAVRPVEGGAARPRPAPSSTSSTATSGRPRTWPGASPPSSAARNG